MLSGMLHFGLISQKEKKKKGEFLIYFSQKIQDMVKIEDACDLL